MVSAPAAAEPSTSIRVKSYALDPANTDRLWEVSEKLGGQRFPWT